ncbi:DUF4249 domain-containing protein [Sphingobacterium hungaricum]
MNLQRLYIFLIALVIFTSCEDIIEIDLNTANPKVVIEGDISNISSAQTIRVSRTVAFTATINSEPIDNASVQVRDQSGRNYVFSYVGNGNYQNNNFMPTANNTYNLTVAIDDELFEASSRMYDYVDIDSIGLVEENLFGTDYYFINLKFTDPINQANYYKYNLSVNGKPFQFSTVFNDKFNDGLNVTHQITNANNDLALGDSVIIRRQIIDQSVYKYWSDLQSINPGSAAPANPKSNISNGALGYFSVSSAKEFGLTIFGL